MTMNPRIYMYFRSGSMKFMEWLTVGAAGFAGYKLGNYISVNAMGNPSAYYNHWIAYSFQKSCNRWEGRQILKKAPMAGY